MQSSLLNLAAGWGLDEEMWLSGFLGFQTSLSRQLCPCSVLSVAPELSGFSLRASGFLARVLGPQNERGGGWGTWCSRRPCVGHRTRKEALWYLELWCSYTCNLQGSQFFSMKLLSGVLVKFQQCLQRT